jgi:hypothetical protein
MQILKKTHKKKCEITNPVSFSIDEIIDSLDPNDIFVIKNLFLYTIKEDFSVINFHLIINEVCVSSISFNVKSENVEELYTKEIYRSIVKSNLELNKNELINLKNFVSV